MPRIRPVRPALTTLAAALGLALALASPVSAQTCGDWNDDGSVTAQDALGILQVAIGASQCDLYHCDIDGSGEVSATDALQALGLAIGQDIAALCPEDPDLCLTDLEFFFQKIWTPIQTDCVSCHNPDGIAASTDHVLLPDSEMGYLEYNFNAWKTYAEITDGKDGRALLLEKPIGIGHAGGQRLGMTESSVHYDNMLELLDRYENPVEGCGETQAFWTGVQMLTSMETLDKAAMIFAGRRPTEAEQAAVLSGDEEDLKDVIRDMMEGENFENFLMESANNHFLTDKYLIRQSNAFGVLQGTYQYPDLYRRIEQVEVLYGDDMGNEAWAKTNEALTREPLELIKFIAVNERSYQEVVTADYMMVNPWSAPIYNTQTSLQASWEDHVWKPGINRGYRLDNYPHAGVLTSPMFLARFPSTATNRNRARARWVYKFFLGVDVEALAPRLVDPAALDDADNPTMNNPNCTVCHTTLDPVAATFQNFGDDGIYLENDTDSLPRTYKRGDLYHDGDRWFRDVRNPGFNGIQMPETETDASLPWLGQQIAQDSRFAKGSVLFWYEGLFGREPASRPTDPTQEDYRGRLSGWAAQDEVFDDIALKFAAGTAGTGRHGAYNVKDLLVELAVSPLFNAVGTDSSDPERQAALSEMGFVRLLTPEQLDRKFTGITGQVWARPWRQEEPDLLNRYRLFYGGIDSSGIIERADELNALMATVPQRMAFEMACPLTVKDMSLDAEDRRLFPVVEPSHIPTDPVGEQAIRENLVWLHYWLLGEYVEADSPEVERAFTLFSEIWVMRNVADKNTNLKWGGGRCEMNFNEGDYIETDENHTIRAWIAVLAYMLTDYGFIYE